MQESQAKNYSSVKEAIKIEYKNPPTPNFVGKKSHARGKNIQTPPPPHTERYSL